MLVKITNGNQKNDAKSFNSLVAYHADNRVILFPIGEGYPKNKEIKSDEVWKVTVSPGKKPNHYIGTAVQKQEYDTSPKAVRKMINKTKVKKHSFI